MIHWLAHLTGFNHCRSERDSNNVLWCVCKGCGKWLFVLSDKLATHPPQPGTTEESQ